jgi:hypothetical protein
VLPSVTNFACWWLCCLSWSFARNVLIVVVPLFLQKNCAHAVEQLINRSCCLIIEHGQNKIILLQESKLSKHKRGLSLFSSFCVLSDWFLKDPSRKKHVKIRKIETDLQFFSLKILEAVL